MKKEEIRPEEAVIEKLRRLHNAKNEEELLAAIGSKAIILGEADKNELKEKQTSNWKKYLTFSFGNNKEKQEEKEPQEKEKINPKQVLKLTEESLQKKSPAKAYTLILLQRSRHSKKCLLPLGQNLNKTSTYHVRTNTPVHHIAIYIIKQIAIFIQEGLHE